MAGFLLDASAPSREAEYVRYLEGDIFGKILFRNFAINVFGLKEEQIDIPIGKWGDIGVDAPHADARVKIGDRWLDVEIKFSRINIANKTNGHVKHNWAFGALLYSPKNDRLKEDIDNKKEKKHYDILFAVGAEILGLEHPKYWQHLEHISVSRAQQGIKVSTDALPDQQEYRCLCGVFLVPFDELDGDDRNYFRRNLERIDKEALSERFAWGWQMDRCQSLWRHATQIA